MTQIGMKSGLAALLFLGACGPLPVYYKEGIQVSRLQQDTLQCETQALKDAPVANEIRQSPPTYFPGGRYCQGGNCWSRPGYWVDGSVYTVDTNKPLRGRLTQSCMAEKGYQQIELDRCTQSDLSGPAKGRDGRVPEVGPSSCAARLETGITTILTPL